MKKLLFKQAILKDISFIRSGYQFREKIIFNDIGDTFIIQMKDIDNYYNLNENNLQKADVKIHDETLLIKNGDILFQARGNNNYATVVKNISGKTVAPSYFFIIKANLDKVDPDYLAWSINHKNAQQYLKQNARGTSIALISKDVLEMLEITLPPLEIQKKVSKIYDLNIKEIKLLDELKEKKKTLIETLLINEVFNK